MAAVINAIVACCTTCKRETRLTLAAQDGRWFCQTCLPGVQPQSPRGRSKARGVPAAPHLCGCGKVADSQVAPNGRQYCRSCFTKHFGAKGNLWTCDVCARSVTQSAGNTTTCPLCAAGSAVRPSSFSTTTRKSVVIAPATTHTPPAGRPRCTDCAQLARGAAADDGKFYCRPCFSLTRLPGAKSMPTSPRGGLGSQQQPVKPLTLSAKAPVKLGLTNKPTAQAVSGAALSHICQCGKTAHAKEAPNGRRYCRDCFNTHFGPGGNRWVCDTCHNVVTDFEAGTTTCGACAASTKQANLCVSCGNRAAKAPAANGRWYCRSCAPAAAPGAPPAAKPKTVPDFSEATALDPHRPTCNACGNAARSRPAQNGLHYCRKCEPVFSISFDKLQTFKRILTEFEAALA
jgi:hypothetical protein